MSQIVPFVMTEKGLEVLSALANCNAVARVVIGRDPAVRKDYSDDIRQLCEKRGLPWSYREDEFSPDEADYVLAISWRWMIDHPAQRLIVFHDSLLPKYRGFAPLVNALINGEPKIGVTALLGASEYDQGDIIAQRSTAISYPVKIADAIALNNANYASLVTQIADDIEGGKALAATPQDHAQSSYSIWRDEADYFIDWQQNAEQILRLIDAVGFPYQGARTKLDGDIVIVESAELVPDVQCEMRHCGKVIFLNDGHPTIICGSGLLKITKAHFAEGERSVLPLNRFRTRFG